MFPRKIVNNSTRALTSHQAVFFNSRLPEKDLVAQVKKMGVTAFLEYDNPNNMHAYLNSYSLKKPQIYDDQRINGVPNYQSMATCCAFTKDANSWYFFPIHRNQLAAVGLTEDDLTTWIKKLNLSKSGFKYYYFGAQEGTAEMRRRFVGACHATDNTFLWVAVAPCGIKGTTMVPYMHWIALRYLINSTTSVGTALQPDGTSQYGDGSRYAYYNIPRVTMLLHEDYGVPFFKAFIWAHLSNPYKGYYSFFCTDSMHVTGAKPDVSITATEFKTAMYGLKGVSGMNAIFSDMPNATKAWTLLKRPYSAPYDYVLLNKLATANNWADFIQHIKSSYGMKSLKKKVNKTANVTKKKTVSR